MNESQLCIEGVTFPLLSCREIEQTLSPIDSGQFIRTVNGELCYLVNNEVIGKYSSTIRCSDRNVPGFTRSWIGKAVKVYCVSKISEIIDVSNLDGDIYSLSKPFVKKSLVLQNENLHSVDYEIVGDNTIKINSSMTDDLIAIYSPILYMRIINFAILEREWGKSNNWSISLEEI